MASRKNPRLLSDRQIRRLVAKFKEELQKEVENRSAFHENLPGTKHSDESKTDNFQESKKQESENLQNSDLKMSDVEYTHLLKYLGKADPNEVSESKFEDKKHLYQESPQNQEQMMDGSLNCENAHENYNFDFFDIMRRVVNDDDDQDSDEEEDEYLDALTSLDQKDSMTVFMNEIRALCIKYIHTVPHVFINELLEKLKIQTGYPFPKDARTFLKTPRQSIVRPMDQGQYCHYGIESALRTFGTTYKRNGVDTDCIKLIVNIDGALLVKSSEDTSWIISISETLLNLVEVVGIYDGEHKPKNSDDLVCVFVDEIITLINNGFQFEDKKYRVYLHCLVCDAPAKAYIIKTKLYSGYYSCTKCTIKGDYENKVMFPTRKQEGTTLRTDEKFINQEYEPNKAVFDEFQMGETLMKKIPKFRPITDVVLDYMHLVCLGVMLKLLELWIQNSKVVLSEYQRKKISEILLSFKDYMPSDFSRNPRKFKNIRRLWKAHELRSFLLYTGPVALYKILPSDLYLNFLYLHVAITILINHILCKSEEYLNYAEKLLVLFVQSYETCYGEENVVFNVHNLIHLVGDVRNFGPLDNFSAFRFENHIRKVKQLIRKGHLRLQQIANRLMEIRAVQELNDGADCEETNFLIKKEMEPFDRIKKDSLTINCFNQKDKYVLLENGMYLDCHCFIKVNGQIYVEGVPFKTIGNFYERPLQSSILSINIIQRASSIKCKSRFPIQQIRAKICKLPLERAGSETTDDESSGNESSRFNEPNMERFVAFPILHTLRQI